MSIARVGGLHGVCIESLNTSSSLLIVKSTWLANNLFSGRARSGPRTLDSDALCATFDDVVIVVVLVLSALLCSVYVAVVVAAIICVSVAALISVSVIDGVVNGVLSTIKSTPSISMSLSLCAASASAPACNDAAVVRNT